MAATSATYINVNYQAEAEKIVAFLEKFKTRPDKNEAVREVRRISSIDDGSSFKYMEQLQAIADRTQDTLLIELDDIEAFDPNDDSLVTNIEKNAKRYENLFCKAIDQLLPPPTNAAPNDESSPIEVIMHQRRQRDEALVGVTDRMFPPMMTRRFSVHFKSRSKSKPMAVREIKGSFVGNLVHVRGIVTRVSNVKPMAVVLTLSCDQCGSEVFQEVNSNSFTPLSECPSDDCKKNDVKGKLYMQTRACKFLKFQEVKLQELTDQVPMGHIPRTMTVHLTESLTRSVTPGDVVSMHGIFLPVPYTGFKALKAGLLTDTYLEAQYVDKLKKQYSQMEANAQADAAIEELRQNPDLYSRLAKSIAPEIWGHEDVKKALLLLLVSGVSKETSDGMKIRGDLNICLMGDPGVAKSQLLKYISKIAPRGVYTTGRGSSGVGLTASVARDPVTEEMVLEGGALVLADNGIACIDEFDKMDDSDRTAIHEVMEQQTISISKAGITTTLNARTSILAAANPQYGRYNPKIRPTENINLPAALLSRFDLLFLILDKPNVEDDLRLAQHVTYVHMHSTHPTPANVNYIDVNTMRHYVAKARTYRPSVPRHVADYIVSAYVHLRGRSDELSEFQYTSARTLLSVIRMATALARIRFAPEVDEADVDEALRLMDVSKASLLDRENDRRADPMDEIYHLIRDSARGPDGELERELNYSSILQRCVARGFSEAQLRECLNQYEENGVWMMNASRTKLLWNTGIDE